MERLQQVFALLQPCATFADIGSDHGLIAQYMADRAMLVIAADISPKCLQKAEKLLFERDNVRFVVCDGLEGISEPLDEIALCGMGGHTIVDILKSYEGDARLVIQPQNDVSCVRAFLCDKGYEITHDETAYERGKYYDVIAALKTKQLQTLDDLQLGYGKFYKRKNVLLATRLKEQRNRMQGYKMTDRNRRILREIEEVLKWQELEK